MEHTEFAKPQIDTQFGSIFIKNISMLDFAVFYPDQGIIGHSLEVDIVVSGKRNDKGFVYDFSHLKSLTRDTLKDTIDHALVVPSQLSGVSKVETNGRENWKLEMVSPRGSFDWEYSCPKGAVYTIDSETIDDTILEKEIAKIVLDKLPDTVTKVEVKLREANVGKEQHRFRYTHGLPKHEGLCQRLFHGHRSQIEVFVGDQKRTDLEHYVVNEIFNQNVHIATKNQVAKGILETRSRLHGDFTPVVLSYEGSHGEFQATIPSDRIFTIADDTSIESLTWQIASMLKEKENTTELVRVACYEGINKGAIAEV